MCGVRTWFLGACAELRTYEYKFECCCLDRISLRVYVRVSSRHGLTIVFAAWAARARRSDLCLSGVSFVDRCLGSPTQG